MDAAEQEHVARARIEPVDRAFQQVPRVQRPLTVKAVVPVGGGLGVGRVIGAGGLPSPLDMRAHVPGRGIAGFYCWNPPGRPFDRSHAEKLSPIQPLFQAALSAATSETTWISVARAPAHIITDAEGSIVAAINPEAERILKDCHLLWQNLAMGQDFPQAPGFCEVLADQLRTAPTAQLDLAVANGRLICQATPTRLLGLGPARADHMFVALDLQVSLDVAKINYVMELPLTPLQREIALFAMQGNERARCCHEFGISAESLKKHLRPIFQATTTTRWSDLQTMPTRFWLRGDAAP